MFMPQLLIYLCIFTLVQPYDILAKALADSPVFFELILFNLVCWIQETPEGMGTEEHEEDIWDDYFENPFK